MKNFKRLLTLTLLLAFHPVSQAEEVLRVVPIPPARPLSFGEKTTGAEGPGEWHDARTPLSFGEDVPSGDEALAEAMGVSIDELSTGATEPTISSVDYSGELFAAVKNYEGTATNELPGTEGGTLACAAAVNAVTGLVLDEPLMEYWDGLSTTRMDAKLQEMVLLGKAQEVDLANAKPGDIIMSPTGGGEVGHVGYIGEGDKIYSNSSFGRDDGDVPRFIQNYDRGCWMWAFSSGPKSACSDPRINTRGAPEWPKQRPTRIYRLLKDQ